MKLIRLPFRIGFLLFLGLLSLAACAPATPAAPAAPPEAPTTAPTEATIVTTPTVAAGNATTTTTGAATTVATTTTAISTTTPATTSALTEEELANASYPSEFASTGTVQLENGEYREPVAPGSATELVVTLEATTFGDLNGDGVADAAVVLVSEPGGSGTFFDLYAVLDENGEPVAVASALLGDRIQLQSIAIDAGDIRVEMVNHGPTDAMCCPSQEVTQTYQLQNDELVLINTTNAPD